MYIPETGPLARVPEPVDEDGGRFGWTILLLFAVIVWDERCKQREGRFEGDVPANVETLKRFPAGLG